VLSHDDLELGAEGRHVEAEPLGELREAVHHAGRLIVERGRRLVEHHLSARRHTDEVGERPPDINANPISHAHVLLVRR
jgi:hypothetical protein